MKYINGTADRMIKESKKIRESDQPVTPRIFIMKQADADWMMKEL